MVAAGGAVAQVAPLDQDGFEPAHRRVAYHPGACGATADDEYLGGDTPHPPNLTEPAPRGRVATD